MIEAMKSVSLGDVSTVITSGSRGWARYYAGDGSPFIRMTNLRRDGIALDLEDLRYVSLPENSVEAKRTKLKKNDILVSITAELGKIGFVRNLFENDAFISQHVCLIRLESPEIDNEYAAYLLASEPERRRLNRLNDAGAKAGLNLQTIAGYRLTFPPLPEQRKIAEILRTWDEAIEAATKLVTALNARREALRTKLVTEADLGGRPTVFGEFLTESRILGSDGASARKITVKLYGKGAVPKSDKRDGSTKTRYYRRSPGQLIYSKLDFLNGAFALVPESLQGYESSLDLPAFDISEPVNPRWLIEYLTRPAYYTAQLHLARGQRKARRIAPNDFLASPVKLPRRDRQDEIAAVLAVADREITLRETELDTLTSQKRGLMQKLLTGEWWVKR